MQNSVSTTAILDPRDCLVRDEARELCSCFGIEFHPVCLTPFGELVRVNVYTDDANTLGLEFLSSCLGGGKPLMVSPVEFVAVLEH